MGKNDKTLYIFVLNITTLFNAMSEKTSLRAREGVTQASSCILTTLLHRDLTRTWWEAQDSKALTEYLDEHSWPDLKRSHHKGNK